MNAVEVNAAMLSYTREFTESGYFISEGVLSDADVERLRNAIADLPETQEVRRRRGVYGVRNLLEICPQVRELAKDARIRRFVEPCSSTNCRVRIGRCFGIKTT